MAEKLCSACKTAKPVSEFHCNSRAADGLRSSCKPCVKVTNAASVARHHDKRKAEKRAEYERVKATPEYKARVKAYQEATREEKRAYDAQRHSANAEAIKRRVKVWTEQNRQRRRVIVKNYDARRRAWKRAGVSTPDLAAWIERQPKQCYWCDGRCPDLYHVDHYTPLSKGGEHELGNLVIACPSCNLKKNAKDPLTFAQEVGRLL